MGLLTYIIIIIAAVLVLNYLGLLQPIIAGAGAVWSFLQFLWGFSGWFH